MAVHSSTPGNVGADTGSSPASAVRLNGRLPLRNMTSKPVRLTSTASLHMTKPESESQLTF